MKEEGGCFVCASVESGMSIAFLLICFDRFMDDDVADSVGIDWQSIRKIIGDASKALGNT